MGRHRVRLKIISEKYTDVPVLSDDYNDTWENF